MNKPTLRTSFAAVLCVAVLSCSAPPPGRAPTSSDPFERESTADRLAADGRYEEALEGYSWVLDHGVAVDPAFRSSRRVIVTKIAELGQHYPPATSSLTSRLEALATDLERAATTGERVNGMDVLLFAWIARTLGRTDRVVRTYGYVKAQPKSHPQLRFDLWATIEENLVERREYDEAAANEDGIRALRYYLDMFRAHRNDAAFQAPIDYTVRMNGGTHYEALLGAGKKDDAKALEDELIAYAPGDTTVASLIEHATRAGAEERVAELRARVPVRTPVRER